MVRGPRPASIPRRVLAASIDGLAMFVGLGGVAAGIYGIAEWRGWDAKDAESTWDDGRLGWATDSLSVALRNARTPGQRVMGLRKVDARTGGPVTLHSAIAARLVQRTIARAMEVATRPTLERNKRTNDAYLRELNAIRARHADDDYEAVMAEVRERNLKTGCGPPSRWLVSPAVLTLCTALLSCRRQTLLDRLAGTMIVRTR